MNTDVKKILNAISQLSPDNKIELAKEILKPIEPRKDKKFDISEALKIAMQLPVAYKYPICKFLLEADQIWQNDQLSIDDIANMAGALLWMTQDHSDQQGMPGLKIGHGFIMQMNLQQALEEQ